MDWRVYLLANSSNQVHLMLDSVIVKVAGLHGLSITSQTSAYTIKLILQVFLHTTPGSGGAKRTRNKQDGLSFARFYIYSDSRIIQSENFLAKSVKEDSTIVAW